MLESYQQFAIVVGDSAQSLTEQLNAMLYKLRGKHPNVTFEGMTARICYDEVDYEPEPEEVLNLLIPKYINSLIYGGLMQSYASENGARMQAMDSATGNAEEMIADLELSYNRARQASITQELTEIIAGANAIN